MYRVRLEAFEGPLDLLLFFIRRDELDVHDIPIAQITDEFLGYVQAMEEVDLDGVGEFIYMAALLIRIKAQLLLPRPETDEEGEPVDPRRELVERLLEYARYREAAQGLQERHRDRAALFVRENPHVDVAGEPGEETEVAAAASLFDLIGALRRVLATTPPEPVHHVERVVYSVVEQRAFVDAWVAARGRAAFSDLVRARPKGFVIATFLAVLELAREGTVRLRLSGRSDFFVEAPPEAAEGHAPTGEDPA